MALNFILLVITAVASIVLGFFSFSASQMEKYYIYSVYYFLLANLLLWIFSLVRATNPDLNKFKVYFKNHWQGISIAATIMLLGSIAVKPEFRILADETNLLSMSQSLYETRECKNLTSVNYFYFGFKDVNSFVNDKRPALFPLTLSFMHSIFGYKPENIFLLNAISGFLSLLLFYHLLYKRYSKFWGICGIFALASFPLFMLYANSGGFEVFNLLFSLILFKLVLDFLEKPTMVWAEALILMLPLISQTRYESVVAIFCVLPVIFYWLPKVEYTKISYKCILTPLLFIPVAWLRIITNDDKSLQVQEVGKAFSWEFFEKNFQNAIPFFFGTKLDYGMIPILSGLAVIGFVWALLDHFGQKPNKTRVSFWAVAWSFYILHAFTRFFYYWGDFTYQFNSRLAIIFLPLCATLAIDSLNKLNTKFRIRQSYCLIAIISLLVVYWPVAGQNFGVRDLTLYREFRIVKEYLENNYPDKRDYILVADRANMYVPFKYNSINFKIFKSKLQRFNSLLAGKTYTYVIFVQSINRHSKLPENNTIIPSEYKVKQLYESQIKADSFLRFSLYKPE